MTEDQVRQIAQQYVIDKALDKCSIVAVRRFKRSECSRPTTFSDEWIVQFSFDVNEDDGVFSNPALVVIDDFTGEPHLFETL